MRNMEVLVVRQQDRDAVGCAAIIEAESSSAAPAERCAAVDQAGALGCENVHVSASTLRNEAVIQTV